MTTNKPPYPKSAAVDEAVFAPASSIVREAVGSDNWPITWADDDHLYTSYGDGWGFEPVTERKLSLGFARVEGMPSAFRGANIRSESGEREGDGPAGPKASGLLSLGGVLYALVRNVANSQLMWSEDRGRTWDWGFRFKESFGCPGFLNFGKDYAGARDDYVYIYSSDGPSAYEAYDQIALARVPREKICEGTAYEFFVSAESAGQAVWSGEIAQRGPVFSFPGNCQRLDAVYHPGLRRYLLLLGYGHRGAWGIFDAPEPWGPWTTVFHTGDWGLGDTHGYRLPSKWIEPEGNVLHIVFSGRSHEGVEFDAFCVRKLTLKTATGR